MELRQETIEDLLENGMMVKVPKGAGKDYMDGFEVINNSDTDYYIVRQEAL